MKKFFLLTSVLLLVAASNVFAQFQDFENGNQEQRQRSNNRIIDRLRFGGNFGLGFGSGTLSVQFNPCVGYRFNEYLTAGLITTYEYYKYSSISYSSHIYGGGVYADCTPIDFLVIHGEVQAINYDNYYNYYNNSERTLDIPILIGGGYRRQISDRASINMMILWNLNATDGLENNTSFSNPIVRISFIF